MKFIWNFSTGDDKTFICGENLLWFFQFPKTIKLLVWVYFLSCLWPVAITNLLIRNVNNISNLRKSSNQSLVGFWFASIRERIHWCCNFFFYFVTLFVLLRIEHFASSREHKLLSLLKTDTDTAKSFIIANSLGLLFFS